MVKIAGVSVPGTGIDIERRKPRIFLQKIIPGREISKRLDRGGLGLDFTIRGTLTGSTRITDRTTIEAWADGNSRTVDFEEGTANITCLLLDPLFRDDPAKPGRISFEFRLMQTA